MPKLSLSAVPSYRLHKQSGQGIVTLNGRDICLGIHGTAESRQRYNRLIAEWLANGRQLKAPGQAYNVSMLILAFWKHAQTHYRDPDGNPTGEAANYRNLLKLLRKLYGNTPVANFGPLCLKAFRGELIKRGWVRTSINRQVNRLRHVFKWGVENELVPASVHQGLAAVSGLKAGRSDAAESEPVRPVPEATVAATLPKVSPQVQAMIRIQLLTGMRPGEIVRLRGADLDTTGRIWIYTPHRHKTLHHGHERVIYIGPQARRILEPLLRPDLSAFIFSPKDAEQARRAKLAAGRKTPDEQGNRPGTNRKKKPKKAPGGRYTVRSYCAAIYAGCDAAFPPPVGLRRLRVRSEKRPESTRWETIEERKARLGEKGWAELKEWVKTHRWHPHQLRHSAATQLRKQYGLEAARVVLGHRSAAVAEVYAEIDRTKAAQIMGEVG